MRVYRRKLKPSLADIKSSKTIDVGCEGDFPDSFKRIAPNSWILNGNRKWIYTDLDVQSYIYRELRMNMEWQLHDYDMRINRNVAFNDKMKQIAYFF